MKRLYWILVLAGLVIFVAVYAFVFPQSQMPIRLVKLGQCASFVPPQDSIYNGNWFVIDSAGHKIDLPQTEAKLPEGLRWDKPKLLGFNITNGYAYATLLDKTYMFDSKSWLLTNEQKESNMIIDQMGFIGKRIVSATNGTLKLTDLSRSGKLLEISLSNRIKIDNFSLPIDTKGFIGVQSGSDKFYLTEPNIGRIRKVYDKAEKLLDRSQLEAQAIPSDLATDGKQLFVMLSDYGNSTGSYPRIQVYDKNLEFIREFAKSRTKAKPAAIEFFKSMVLLLWDDGLLEAFSADGNILASWKFGVSGVDLVSVGDILLVMDETSIEAVSITVVKPNMPIWPRIVSLGLINGTQKTSIFVKATLQPTVAVKGQNLTVEKIANQNGIWKIDLTIRTAGLPAFETYKADLVLDIDQTHEIVPIYFVPFGEVREFYIFGDRAVNMNTGENIETVSLEGLGKVITNEYTNQAFVLSPPPGQLIGK